MMKEKFFIVILGLQGHKRMGKTCAPKMLCFLRHPSVYLYGLMSYIGGGLRAGQLRHRRLLRERPARVL